ncbi:hypothetical protein KM043_009856 [Ampulex compressa]|nr:hypothetical protein KM043_009856 [Ampulex compressa]
MNTKKEEDDDDDDGGDDEDDENDGGDEDDDDEDEDENKNGSPLRSYPCPTTRLSVFGATTRGTREKTNDSRRGRRSAFLLAAITEGTDRYLQERRGDARAVRETPGDPPP